MTTASIIFLSLVGISILILIIWSIILDNNTLYNRFYNRESYNVLEELNKTPIKKFTCTDKRFRTFTVDTRPSWRIVIFKRTDNSYMTGVFDGDKCIASSFYEKGSTKLANKLMQLL